MTWQNSMIINWIDFCQTKWRYLQLCGRMGGEINKIILTVVLVIFTVIIIIISIIIVVIIIIFTTTTNTTNRWGTALWSGRKAYLWRKEEGLITFVIITMRLCDNGNDDDNDDCNTNVQQQSKLFWFSDDACYPSPLDRPQQVTFQHHHLRNKTQIITRVTSMPRK